MQKQAMMVRLGEQVKGLQGDVRRLETENQRLREWRKAEVEDREAQEVDPDDNEQQQENEKGGSSSKLEEVPEEYVDDELTAAQHVIKSKDTQRSAAAGNAVRNVLEQLVRKMVAYPQNVVSVAVAAEFGSVEACRTLVVPEPDSRCLASLLKVMSKLVDDSQVLQSADDLAEYTAEQPDKTLNSNQGLNADNRLIVRPLMAHKSSPMHPSKADSQDPHPENEESPPHAVETHSGRRRASEEAVDENSVRRHRREDEENRGRVGEKWGRVLSSGRGSVMVGGEDRKARVKQLFNPYTKKKSEYFDPYIQYGGRSM